MNVLRISTEGALPSGLPDVFLGLGDSPQQAERGTDDEPVPRFCKGLYKHLPCLPVAFPRSPAYQPQFKPLLYNIVCTSKTQGGSYMEAKEYAYIRVSSKDQNEDRQKIAMVEYGIAPGNIYMDKQSGKDFESPGYQRPLRKLKTGDTIVIKSIDRLGRNYDEILEQWRLLTKQKQVDIIVLDMPLLNTKQGKNLTGVVIADIVLQLLSYVAQTEREFNRQRQAEGIAAAKSRGVQFGRRRIDRPEMYPEIKKAWEAGELTAGQAADALGVSRTTFFKWVRSEEI